MSPAASDIDQRSCLSPSVVVLQADPDNLLGTAFLWCGWRVLPSSGRPCPTADLGDTGWFDTAAANISSADLLFVSRDQVARPRAGEVPEFFDDGRAFRRPLADSQAVGRDPTAQLPGGTPGMATDSPSDAAIAFLQQQVQQVRERGGGCVVKEALVAANSRLPTLTANALSEAWHDTPYSLCVFAGARCQSQRLRHNIDELASGPPLLCQHFHDPSEWDPSWVDDEPWSPCHEEAQITAALAFFIAVSASWWAARHGLAVVQVHRLPPVEITGRREHWLRIAPESLRSAAMAPLAISLGMRPGQLPAADQVPVKALAEDRVVEKGLLPAGCVYVGQGNYQHRIPTSKWRNPWVAGLTCDPGQALARYANFVAAELWHDLAELIGKTLLSDTPWRFHVRQMCWQVSFSFALARAVLSLTPRRLVSGCRTQRGSEKRGPQADRSGRRCLSPSSKKRWFSGSGSCSPPTGSEDFASLWSRICSTKPPSTPSADGSRHEATSGRDPSFQCLRTTATISAAHD